MAPSLVMALAWLAQPAEPAEAAEVPQPAEAPLEEPAVVSPAAEVTDAVVIIDSTPSVDATAGLAAAPSVAAVSEGVTRWSADASARLALDVNFEGGHEDVMESWTTARLRVDHRPHAGLRAVVEGRMRWGVVGEDPRPDATLWLVNARAPKWAHEATLREAWVENAAGDWSVAGGLRMYTWGKNEILAAADVLNPIDARLDPLVALRSPRELKAPVVAVEGGRRFGDAALTLVLVPFFSAHRVAWWGRDLSAAPPGSDLERRLATLGAVHPSIEDELQGALVGTEVPDERPEHASLALRGTSRLGSWDLGVTLYHGWDRTPAVTLDRDLEVLLAAADDLLADPGRLATDPVLRAAAAAVQQKAAVGMALASARYQRMQRVAFEAEGVVGDVVLRTDLGVTPRQTMLDTRFGAHRLTTATAVVGAELQHAEQWFFSVSVFGQWAFAAPAGSTLLGLERSDGAGNGRRTVFAPGGVAVVRWVLEDHDLELWGTGVRTVGPDDTMAAVEARWARYRPFTLRVGALAVAGAEGSLGGTYGETDLAYVEVQAAW